MILNRVSVYPNRKGAVVVGLSLFFSRKFSTSSPSLKPHKRLNLDSLLGSFPSLSENLHLYTTVNIKKCYPVLLRMYNSLIDPVVKLYIQNNCLHLMSLDKQTKEITPKDFLDYVVDGQDKQGHPSLYTGKSGCYAFLCLKTGDYYVGSAVCLNTRTSQLSMLSVLSSRRLFSNSCRHFSTKVHPQASLVSSNKSYLLNPG